jgi:hypothetical protein
VPNFDPQEQARDLILGKHFAGTAHQAASLDSKTDAMPGGLRATYSSRRHRR